MKRRSEIPLTKEVILLHVRYEPETGYLIVLPRKRVQSRFVGLPAGTIIANGYRSLGICGVRLYAHAVVWFIHHGFWPQCDIDHEDRNRDNNRIENLRLADRSSNNINSCTPKNNTSGFKGAYFDKRRDRWGSEIWVRKRKRFLGYYDTAQAAGAAYLSAVAVHYPGVLK